MINYDIYVNPSWTYKQAVKNIRILKDEIKGYYRLFLYGKQKSGQTLFAPLGTSSTPLIYLNGKSTTYGNT